VAGRFESGAAAGEDPAVVADTVLEGYLDGLAAAGRPVAADDVRRAFALHLLVRSGFSAPRLHHRADLDADQRAELLAVRAPLARFAVDLGRSLT